MNNNANSFLEEKDLVSIIIPCYNQGIYIEETLDSVKKQTYKDIEVIIVDDGSTDEYTIQILKKIENEYKNIYILRTNNQGLAMARNNGIKKSRGKYILPLDSDDKIHKTYIEKAVKLIKENNYGVIYCIAEFFDEKKGIWGIKDFSYKRMLKENLVFCSALFKRSDYDKTNGYNANMKYGLEDWDFWLSLIELDVKFYRINEVLFFYRFKRKSMLRDLEKNEFEMKMQILKNHQSLYQKHAHENSLTKCKKNKIYEKITKCIFCKLQVIKLKIISKK